MMIYRNIGGVLFFSISTLIVYAQHSINILHLFLIPFLPLSIYALLNEYKKLSVIRFSEETVTLEYFNNRVIKKSLEELLEINTVKKAHLFSFGKVEMKFVNNSYSFRDDPIFEQFIINNRNYFNNLNVKIALR